MRHLVSLSFLCLIGLATPCLWAHEGHDHQKIGGDSSSRTWTFKHNASHIHGSYVACRDGIVSIRQADGEIVFVEETSLVESDRKWVVARLARVRALNGARSSAVILVQTPQGGVPVVNQRGKAAGPIEPAEAFAPFIQQRAVQFRQDNRFFYVESSGMPDHPMMVGITAWQQQVPIPQKYYGANAWQVPLKPVVAKSPLSAKSHFFRGAIAIAVNGVPIFNPIKNDGRTDTFLAGELDEYGGHCGRADDYHYHIAPTHLESIVGQGRPLAYALDGYPIYGYTEPDGSQATGLDAFNGHTTKELGYHYHASKEYPYLNGGFHGEVTERDGQVDPQPRASSVREALPPLRGAKIVGFDQKEPDKYRLTYQIQGKEGSVTYQLHDDGSAVFTFVDTDGKQRTENYRGDREGRRGEQRRSESPRPTEARPAERPPSKQPPAPRPDDKGAKGKERNRGESRSERANAERDGVAAAVSKEAPAGDRLPSREIHRSTHGLVVNSPAFVHGGRLPTRYTCDGESASPPVEWEGVPAGTQAFALLLWHTAPDQDKSYWLVYNIPASVRHLGVNEKLIGTIGVNGKGKVGYDPMCSKGSGVKTYHLTLFALSRPLDLAQKDADQARLLRAVQDCKLAESTLDFLYERLAK